MKITIAEPVLTNPLEQFKPVVAENTRIELSKLFTEQPACAEVEPISKEELKALKEEVHADCEMELRTIIISGVPEYRMLQVLGAAGYAGSKHGVSSRIDSYRVEYAFQWARAYLFKNKLPAPSDYPADVFGALQYPAYTCGDMDHKMSTVVGVHISRVLYHMLNALPSALCSIIPDATACTLKGTTEYGDSSVLKPTEVHRCNDIRGTVYTESGTAWFAGFLNKDDVLNLRFRRMRLGAAVKELTGDDGLARKAADIRDIDDFNLVLHPNDRPFGDEYVRMRNEGAGLESCMAHPTSHYSTPFGVHPCDVYSCAYYGQGDNGLVLVEAQQGDVPLGRGILNVNTKQIVRWYGEYRAEVMLRNKFGIEVDTDALNYVQLALIQEGNKIAAPYLDGDQYVRITGNNELYIGYVRDGEINSVMDDASGYQYLAKMMECAISGEYYPEDELEYQEISDTWVHPDNCNRVNRCAVTSEYFNAWSIITVYIDGSDECVWDGVCMADYGYNDLGGDIGWTRDVDDYTYDDVTGQYYPNDEYDELVAERALEEAEENEEEDDAEAA